MTRTLLVLAVVLAMAGGAGLAQDAKSVLQGAAKNEGG
jgi:hypothetical protein